MLKRHSRTSRLARRRARVLGASRSRNFGPNGRGAAASRIAGLVCTLLYVLSQWREIAREFSGRQARYGIARRREHPRRAGHPRRASTTSPSRHNKRWDLTAASQYTLSDQTKKVLQGLTKPVQGDGLCAHRGLRALPQPARGIPVPVQAAAGRVHRSGEAAGARRAAEGERARNDRPRVRRARPAGDVGRRAGPDQRPDQGRPGPAAQGLLHRRDTASATRPDRTSAATAGIAEELGSDNFTGRNARAAAAGRFRPTRRSSSSPGRSPTSSQPEIDKLKALPRQGRQAAGADRSAAEGRRAAADQPDRAAEGLVGRRRQQRRPRSHEPAARRRGRRCRSRRRRIPSHAITSTFRTAHRLSVRALGQAGRGRAQRTHGDVVRP